MYKNIITYTVLLLTVSLLSACEKAIDLKLNDASPQYVVEGVLTNQAGGCKVLVSQTKNFTDNNNFNGVSGAQITISNNGTTYNITPTAQGIYQNTTLTGTPGQTYQLTVSVNGKVFTSTCTMPQQVMLDSIYLVKDNFGDNEDGTIRKNVTVRYQEPGNTKNYYRFVQYIDNRKEKTVFVEDDEFTNGQQVNSQLRSDTNDEPERDIRPGNTVAIEMLNIDASVFKYWFSLNESAGGDGNNAAPSNPISNIKGGALGYFSAHTIQRKTLVAP